MANITGELQKQNLSKSRSASPFNTFNSQYMGHAETNSHDMRKEVANAFSSATIVECLKGNSLVAPTNKFISVKDLTLDDIDLSEMELARSLNQIHDQFRKFKDNRDLLIEDNLRQTMEVENRIFEKYLGDASKRLGGLEEIQKINELMLGEVAEKVRNDYERRMDKLGLERLKLIEEKLEEEVKEIREQELMSESEKLKNFEERNQFIYGEIEKVMKRKEVGLNDKEIDRLFDLTKKTTKKKVRSSKSKVI